MANRKTRTEDTTSYRLKHDDLCNLALAGKRYSTDSKIEIFRLGLVALVTRRIPTPDVRASLSDIDTHNIPQFTSIRTRWGRSDIEMMKLCKKMYMTKKDADTVRLGVAALAEGKIK